MNYFIITIVNGLSYKNAYFKIPEMTNEELHYFRTLPLKETSLHIYTIFLPRALPFCSLIFGCRHKKEYHCDPGFV